MNHHKKEIIALGSFLILAGLVASSGSFNNNPDQKASGLSSTIAEESLDGGYADSMLEDSENTEEPVINTGNIRVSSGAMSVPCSSFAPTIQLTALTPTPSPLDKLRAGQQKVLYFTATNNCPDDVYINKLSLSMYENPAMPATGVPSSSWGIRDSAMLYNVNNPSNFMLGQVSFSPNPDQIIFTGLTSYGGSPLGGAVPRLIVHANTTEVFSIDVFVTDDPQQNLGVSYHQLQTGDHINAFTNIVSPYDFTWVNGWTGGPVAGASLTPTFIGNINLSQVYFY